MAAKNSQNISIVLNNLGCFKYCAIACTRAEFKGTATYLRFLEPQPVQLLSAEQLIDHGRDA